MAPNFTWLHPLTYSIYPTYYEYLQQQNQCVWLQGLSHVPPRVFHALRCMYFIGFLKSDSLVLPVLELQWNLASIYTLHLASFIQSTILEIHTYCMYQ